MSTEESGTAVSNDAAVEHWQRLPLRALLHLCLEVLRENWALIAGGAVGGGWQIEKYTHIDLPAWALGPLAIVLMLLAALWRWWHLRYAIHAHHVHAVRGRWSREEHLLPFARVQGVRATQPIGLRLLGLHEVALESSGSESEEVKLPGVSDATLAQLRAAARRARSPQTPASHVSLPADADSVSTNANAPLHAPDAGQAEAEPDSDHAAPVLHRLNWRQIMLVALTSGRTLAIAPLLLYFANRVGDDALDRWLWKPLKVWTENHSDTFMHALVGGVISAAVIVLVIAVLAIAWGLWRYWDFRLQQLPREWHQHSGLITRYAQTLRPERACAVIWEQGALQRPFGRGWLRVAVAGENETQAAAEGKTSRSFRVPWLGLRAALRLRNEVFNRHPETLKKFARFQGIDRYYMERNRRYFIVAPCVLAAATLGVLSIWQWPLVKLLLMFALPLLPLLILHAEWQLRRRYRHWRFAVSAQALRIQQGMVSRQLAFIPWSAVQGVVLEQSPGERKRQLASLQFILPHASVELPCLPLADAQALFNYAAAQAVMPATTASGSA